MLPVRRHLLGGVVVMSRQRVEATQEKLRQATCDYIAALPAMHREAILLMEADLGRPGYAIIAGAIEREMAAWRAGMLEDVGHG